MSQKQLDINLAVEHIKTHASLTSRGQCARSVRLALSAGGLKIQTFPRVAKEYGPVLINNGFKQISQVGYSPQKGDIVVMQDYVGGNNAGHIAMYTGDQWISDFVQRDMWAGPGYRNQQANYAIYRFGK